MNFSRLQSTHMPSVQPHRKRRQHNAPDEEEGEEGADEVERLEEHGGLGECVRDGDGLDVLRHHIPLLEHDDGPAARHDRVQVRQPGGAALFGWGGVGVWSGGGGYGGVVSTSLSSGRTRTGKTSTNETREGPACHATPRHATHLLDVEGDVDLHVAGPLGEDDLVGQVRDPHLREGHGEGHRQRVALPLWVVGVWER